jgi:hypothetical protein
MAKTKQTLFVIFASPLSQVAVGTCYVAQDGTTTIIRSKAARFHSFTDAKEFAIKSGIALNGHTYIGLEDFIDSE